MRSDTSFCNLSIEMFLVYTLHSPCKHNYSPKSGSSSGSSLLPQRFELRPDDGMTQQPQERKTEGPHQVDNTSDQRGEVDNYAVHPLNAERRERFVRGEKCISIGAASRLASERVRQIHNSGIPRAPLSIHLARVFLYLSLYAWLHRYARVSFSRCAYSFTESETMGGARKSR